MTEGVRKQGDRRAVKAECPLGARETCRVYRRLQSERGELGGLRSRAPTDGCSSWDGACIAKRLDAESSSAGLVALRLFAIDEVPVPPLRAEHISLG